MNEEKMSIPSNNKEEKMIIEKGWQEYMDQKLDEYEVKIKEGILNNMTILPDGKASIRLDDGILTQVLLEINENGEATTELFHSNKKNGVVGPKFKLSHQELQAMLGSSKDWINQLEGEVDEIENFDNVIQFQNILKNLDNDIEKYEKNVKFIEGFLDDSVQNDKE